MRRNFSTDHHFAKDLFSFNESTTTIFDIHYSSIWIFVMKFGCFLFIFSSNLDFWISSAYKECIRNLVNSLSNEIIILFTDLQISYDFNYFWFFQYSFTISLFSYIQAKWYERSSVDAWAAAWNAHKPIGCSSIISYRNKCIWPYDWHTRPHTYLYWTFIVHSI